MAKPAVHALKEFCAALHALRRSRRLRRYHQWDGWFLLLKSRRKRLGVRDQVDPLLAQQGFQEGIPLAWTPRLMVSYKSLSKGKLPLGVDRHLKVALVKSRGLGSR
jgi:hypothetical protein